MQEQRGVTTIVENHVWPVAIRPSHHLLGRPPVLLEGFTLPGEHRHTIGFFDGAVRANSYRCRRMVLRGKDVAACPAHLGTKFDECFNQHCSLNGHVQRPRDSRTFQWFRSAVLFAKCTQAGHFVFGKMDFFAAKWRQRNIGDAIILALGEGG